MLDQDPSNVHALMHLVMLGLKNPTVGLSSLHVFSWLARLEGLCSGKCWLEEALRVCYESVVEWHSKRKVGAGIALEYLYKLAALDGQDPERVTLLTH